MAFLINFVFVFIVVDDYSFPKCLLVLNVFQKKKKKFNVIEICGESVLILFLSSNICCIDELPIQNPFFSIKLAIIIACITSSIYCVRMNGIICINLNIKLHLNYTKTGKNTFQLVFYLFTFFRHFFCTEFLFFFFDSLVYIFGTVLLSGCFFLLFHYN